MQSSKKKKKTLKPCFSKYSRTTNQQKQISQQASTEQEAGAKTGAGAG